MIVFLLFYSGMEEFLKLLIYARETGLFETLKSFYCLIGRMDEDILMKRPTLPLGQIFRGGHFTPARRGHSTPEPSQSIIFHGICVSNHFLSSEVVKMPKLKRIFSQKLVNIWVLEHVFLWG